MEAQCKPMHRRFYMPSEVALHNTPEDCWLSWFGEVYDLSPVLDQNKGVDTKPFIDSGGQDITHWFDNNTRNVSTQSLYVSHLPHSCSCASASARISSDWLTPHWETFCTSHRQSPDQIAPTTFKPRGGRMTISKLQSCRKGSVKFEWSIP